ncbi:MAG: NAD(P)H-dependent oxidoreductase subunit E [Bacteroidales bacterium]
MTKEQLEIILSKYPVNRKDGLLPLLQDIQHQEGHLTDALLNDVGKHLNIPSNKVYGVATFYNQFRFHSTGLYHIRICGGTACHLYKSSTYLEEIEKQLKVKEGNTSRDRKFSLELTTCMGACESAPVIQVNESLYTHVNEAELDNLLRTLKEKTE